MFILICLYDDGLSSLVISVLSFLFLYQLFKLPTSWPLPSLMEPSYPPPRRELQLQGPRPNSLQVSKFSHRIKKQPPRDPVIIYTISPKVIHVDPANFMGIVQSLTGPSETEHALSPAAKLATVQRTYSGRDPPSNLLVDILDQLEMDQPVEKPGILTPAPASLPPISPGIFSPSYLDPGFLSFMHDLSSAGLFSGRLSHSPGGAVGAGGGGGDSDGNFLVSPGKFLSTPLVPSPGAAVWDLFKQFQNLS